MGLDQVTIDDSYVKITGQGRIKEFANFKNVNQQRSSAEKYVVQGSDPMMVFYLGVQRFGTKYTKVFHGLEDLLSNTGGFAVGLAYFFAIAVAFLMQINHRSKMIQLIIGPAV